MIRSMTSPGIPFAFPYIGTGVAFGTAGSLKGLALNLVPTGLISFGLLANSIFSSAVRGAPSTLYLKTVHTDCRLHYNNELTIAWLHVISQ